MDRKKFYARLRSRDVPSFGTTLSQRQVDGMEALLDEGAKARLPMHHMANVLAQVHRETGGGMYPIKETVMPHHKDKNPSDAEVIRRLDRAWAAGQLKGVRAPYWRDGEFGRGQIQLTHEENRRKFGITNRDDLLKPSISAMVAVVGMRDGMFRKHKLADYDFPAALHSPPAQNPRRIVNGQDGSDKQVAGHHLAFVDALTAAGWQEKPAQRPQPRPSPSAPETKPSGLSALLAALAGLFRRT